MDFTTYTQKNYNSHIEQDWKDYIIDTKNLFKNFSENKIILNSKNIDVFIKKITFGKNRCLLNPYINSYRPNNKSTDKILPLNLLTEKHLLTKKQMARILDCIKESITDFTWVKNLINLGYVLTSEEMLALSKIGYEGIIEYTHDEGKLNIEFLNKYILQKIDKEKSNLLLFENLCEILKKYNLVPNNDTFELLSRTSEQNKKNSILSEEKFNKIIELGYIINKFTLEKIIRNLQNNYYVSFRPELNIICKNIIKSITSDMTNEEIYDALYKISCNSENKMELIDITTKELININKIPPLRSILNIIEPHIIINGNNKFEQIYDIFFVQQGYKPDSEICDTICLKNDLLMLKYLISKNLFLTTEKSLINACRAGSYEMIEELVNMKCIPTIECSKNINSSGYYTKILDFLILAGLPVSTELVLEAYRKNKIILNNLYGLEYDDELYYAFYSEYGFAETPSYFNKMDKKKITMRNYFKQPNSLDAVKKYIEDENIVPDQYCYDASFTNYPEVRKWLEDTWNFKPNYLTFILCSDKNIRKIIVEEYIKINKFDKMENYKDLYFKNIEPSEANEPNEPNETKKNIPNTNNISSTNNEVKKAKIVVKGKSNIKEKKEKKYII